MAALARGSGASRARWRLDRHPETPPSMAAWIVERLLDD
jgi:hypothetical protein